MQTINVFPNARGEYVPARQLTTPELAALPQRERILAFMELGHRFEELVDGRLRIVATDSEVA